MTSTYFVDGGRKFVSSTADISDDKLYRYELTRTWNKHKKRVCWVMLNPSTAGAFVNDATIRRVINFSRAWGYGGCVVVNLYALRATKPRELSRYPDPIGPKNDRAIEKALARCVPRVIVAWGAQRRPEGIFRRAGRVLTIIKHAGARTYCLGANGDGTPRHPVRLPGKLTPVPWPVLDKVIRAQ